MNLYLILRKKNNILEFRIGFGIPVSGHILFKQMNTFLVNTQFKIIEQNTSACCSPKTVDGFLYGLTNRLWNNKCDNSLSPGEHKEMAQYSTYCMKLCSVKTLWSQMMGQSYSSQHQVHFFKNMLTSTHENSISVVNNTSKGMNIKDLHF